MTTARRTMIWHRYMQQQGVVGTLITGIVFAALAEEFTRMLLQTRMGALLHNKGMGFVMATVIWAALHIPKALPHAKDGAVPVLFFIQMATLIPHGLLWGYMIHRTKSLLPTVLVHGLNFWGLQNSF